MKHFKHLIVYVSILSILCVALFATNPLKVYADVQATQKAVSHNGAWSGYAFDFRLLGKYFTIEDSTGIPTSTTLLPQYFYTDDQVTFYALDGKKLYTAILNRAVGIVAQTDLLTALYQSFCSLVANVTDTNNYVQGGLYDSNNNFLGYCVNDISGCYYQQPLPEDTPAVDVPDDLSDDVHNHYIYYTDNDTTIPDYLTYTPPNTDNALDKWKTDGTYHPEYDQGKKNNFELVLPLYDICLDYQVVYDSNSWSPIDFTYDIYGCEFHFIDDTNKTFIFNNYGNSWQSFTSQYGITPDNTELLYTDVISNMEVNKSNSTYIYYNIVDRTTGSNITYDTYSMSNNVDSPNLTPSGSSTWAIRLGPKSAIKGNTGTPAFTTVLGKNITIYKDWQTYQNINVNKTYEPNSYKSTIFYNYNVEEDNSFTINYTYIDNSETNNETIYNEGTDIFYDEVDKGEPSIGTPPIEITIIIENVIPENGGGGGNEEPDPDNPNDDDINNDNVLSALLVAIRHFFSVIGQLLGTILTGLLEMINAILESITGVMSSLTGITDFLAALFAWLPTPIPQVIGIGFSMCILAALIKFIRG